MKSRQVNFFLTPNDQAELMGQLAGLGKFVCLAAVSQDSSPRILESAEIKEMGREPLQIFIALQKNVGDIFFRELRTVTFRSVDVVRSPVIKFSRCYQDERCIRRGRLYVINSYYDQNAVISKDEEFLKWSDRLISKTRKVLRRLEPLTHIGPEALRLKEAGLKINLGFG
jgi:hypothetical protein